MCVVVCSVCLPKCHRSLCYDILGQLDYSKNIRNFAHNVFAGFVLTGLMVLN